MSEWAGGDPVVGVIMGSDSDWPVMSAAAEALAEFEIPHEVSVVSAHRTPRRMLDYALGAADRGLRVIIAGAGGAAHLPGMVASATPLPVIGVPVPLANLDGLDSLLSIVQMPAGIPVATVSIGGARNAGLLAVRILGVSDAALRTRMPEVTPRAAFGLIEEAGAVKVFGAGILSSTGEIPNSLFSSDVTRRPFVTDVVINTDYDPSRMQDRLFVAPSLPFLRRLPARLIGLGFRPEHIDHPGTTVQLFGAVIIKVRNFGFLRVRFLPAQRPILRFGQRKSS